MGKENGCQCCELVGVQTGNLLQRKKVRQTDHLPIQILAIPIYLPIYDSLRTSEHPSLSKSLTPQIIKPAPGIRQSRSTPRLLLHFRESCVGESGLR